ncbi:MAG: TIGR04076 family protein [Candidatus Marinimicrobia bacterium]|nr:TIGR04076 family protein [Candidatus Neomarinimicrobiota bacterium]
MDLQIKVIEIKGTCPVYEVGDKFTLKDGYKLVSDIPVCMHAISSLLPYYNALRISEPEEWGLNSKNKKDKAYIQCPDAQEYTEGGTAIFEINRQSKK